VCAVTFLILNRFWKYLAVLCMLPTACSTSIQFWLIFTVDNVKFKRKWVSWKSSRTADKTMRTVTVRVSICTLQSHTCQRFCQILSTFALGSNKLQRKKKGVTFFETQCISRATTVKRWRADVCCSVCDYAAGVQQAFFNRIYNDNTNTRKAPNRGRTNHSWTIKRAMGWLLKTYFRFGS